MADGPLLEALAFGVIMVGCGVLCIFVGRRGAAGRMDFQWGGITKSSVSPQAWQQAHQETGRAMEIAGWWYVLAAVVGGACIAASQTALAVIAIVGLVLVATVWIFVGLARGLRSLS